MALYNVHAGFYHQSLESSLELALPLAEAGGWPFGPKALDGRVQDAGSPRLKAHDTLVIDGETLNSMRG